MGEIFGGAFFSRPLCFTADSKEKPDYARLWVSFDLKLTSLQLGISPSAYLCLTLTQVYQDLAWQGYTLEKGII